jgi:Family of unknown function (DUF5675)
MLRMISQPNATFSALYMMAPRQFICFILEDEYREVKVPGHTRIPAGRYEIKLRKEGGFDQRYRARFGAMHRGMLHLQDVPGFTYILIHCGNAPEDTSGCLLTGDTLMPRVPMVGGSGVAYARLYLPLRDQLEGRGRVWISVIDLD